MVFAFAVVATTDISASTKTTNGLYTTLEYTNEFFPEYEEFTVSFFIQKTDELELTKNQSLYMTGYRIVLNDSLLAYIDHSGDYRSYTPVLEKKELFYDADDYQLNTSDFNTQHKLIVQIFAVVVDDDTGEEELIADDYLPVEVMFLREANTNEIIQIMLVTVIPILIFTIVFFVKRQINNSTFENVTYVSMMKYYLRRFFLSKYKEQETTRSITISQLPTEKLEETQTQLRNKKILEKIGFVFIISNAPLIYAGILTYLIADVAQYYLLLGILILTALVALEIISWLLLRLRFLLQQPKEQSVVRNLEQPKIDKIKQLEKESKKEKAEK